MSSRWRLRSPLYLNLVETRAYYTRDRIERLRFLRGAMGLPRSRRGTRGRLAGLVVLLALAFASPSGMSDARSSRPREAAGRKLEPVAEARPSGSGGNAEVWLVEGGADFDLYSNGLRIENRFAIGGQPRSYQVWPRTPGQTDRKRRRSEPAGIVFHSSEGDVASFEPAHNGALKRQGLGLLEYARSRGLYHFVIDRFGRVHRVVEEGSKADHAGHSLWADRDWIYVNLNSSFLGICFEAVSRDPHGISLAQRHAGRVLVEMLRARYRIPASNCVTHAQVSVNPRNFLVGYHTDWAGGFPFADLGLAAGGEQPLPGLYLFGFEADSSFVGQAGSLLRKSVWLAETMVQEAAAAQRVPLLRYRADLQQSYRRISAALEGGGAMR